ncbi:MAG: TraB/GumN family protein [Betaproteobacteria bacterium]|nr:TraB/GumN family protein [Betaproteobacteria bacterium]
MSRKKTVFVMVIFLLCWASASLRAAESARLPFFEARKDGVQIYILGTLHASKGDPLRSEIKQALARSSQLIMEVSSEEMLTLAQSMATRLCQDACLRRQVSSASLDKLTALLPEAGAAMDHLPAWMVSMMLALVDASKAGLSVESGTEQQLMNLWGNRPTRGLETGEEQINALASFDDATQREMLEGYLALPEEKRVALNKMLYQLWQNGDVDVLFHWYQKTNEEENLSPSTARKIDEKMIFSRNQRFVERLRPFLAPDKPVFMAVGALHLGGDQGVLALLRAQGFTVTAR